MSQNYTLSEKYIIITNDSLAREVIMGRGVQTGIIYQYQFR